MIKSIVYGLLHNKMNLFCILFVIAGGFFSLLLNESFLLKHFVLGVGVSLISVLPFYTFSLSEIIYRKRISERLRDCKSCGCKSIDLNVVKHSSFDNVKYYFIHCCCGNYTRVFDTYTGSVNEWNSKNE